jgi:hypothetical protein
MEALAATGWDVEELLDFRHVTKGVFGPLFDRCSGMVTPTPTGGSRRPGSRRRRSRCAR